MLSYWCTYEPTANIPILPSSLPSALGTVMPASHMLAMYRHLWLWDDGSDACTQQMGAVSGIKLRDTYPQSDALPEPWLTLHSGAVQCRMNRRFC